MAVNGVINSSSSHKVLNFNDRLVPFPLNYRRKDLVRKEVPCSVKQLSVLCSLVSEFKHSFVNMLMVIGPGLHNSVFQETHILSISNLNKASLLLYGSEISC